MTEVQDNAAPANEEKDLVEKLASLARITIEPARQKELEAEFNEILSYISQLDELTVASAATPTLPKLHNAFREDGEPYAPGMWTDRIVKLFPAKSGSSLSVKKIVSND